MTSKSQAISMVRMAVKKGNLARSSKCEICGNEPEDYEVHPIVAHHWNGYDDPLNVWWVCRSCNRILAYKHDGSMDIEQAKKFVRKRHRQILRIYCGDDDAETRPVYQ